MKGNNRKTALFNAIISEYIKTARPVGSKLLVEKVEIDCSPATVRNDMMALEQDGLIVSPHTSAGRIPTAKGYKYYIDNFLNKDIVLKKKHQEEIDIIAKANDGENKLKNIAKEISEISDEAVVVSLGENSFYYTGISNLFKKPEFQNVELMYGLSEIVDQFDSVMADISEHVNDIDILLGNNNPFSSNCSSIFSVYKYNDLHGVIGILGPLRMDYEKNYSLVKYINQLFK